MGAGSGGFRVKKIYVCVLACPLITCVPLNKLQTFPEFQPAHWKDRNDNIE